jgi:hypothetical protein
VTVGSHAMVQGAAHVFTVANTRTPSSVCDASSVDISTTDSKGGVIDGAAAAATEAIQAGALLALSFATAADTPGVTSLATLSFTTAGRVQAGGKVLVSVPEHKEQPQAGFSFEAPTALCSLPVDGAPSVVSAAYSSPLLTITISGAAMAQAVAHAFTISNTRNPSSAVAAASMAVSTQDSSSGIVDGPSNAATDRIEQGVLSTTPKFSMGIGTPGTRSVASLSFTTAGQVLVGGRIVLVMPVLSSVQSGWSFESPSVVFTTPAGATRPTASIAVSVGASSTTLTLTVTGNNTLQQTLAHVLDISNTRTPSSVVLVNSVQLSFQDSEGNNVGPATEATTDIISAGALTGAKTFSTVTNTPGVLQTATVSFTTAGRVMVGGKVLLQMPTLVAQVGWDFELPVITFTVPSNGAPVANANFSLNNATLALSVDGNAMAQSADHVFTVSKTRTPSSVAPKGHALDVQLTTRDQSGGVVDNGTAVTGLLSIGSLGGTPSFVVTSSTPGSTSDATVTFTTSGRILAGGRVILQLPAIDCEAGSGWALDEQNSQASGLGDFQVASSSWSQPTRTLAVTVGGGGVEMATVVQFNVTSVTAPSASVAQAVMLSVNTTDSLLNVIDEQSIAEKMTVAQITSSRMLNASWTVLSDRALVLTVANLSFVADSNMPAGFAVEFALPMAAGGWDLAAVREINSASVTTVSKLMWDKASSKFSFATEAATGINAGATVRFSFSNVRTPRATGALHGQVTTKKGGCIIETTNALAVDEITPGSLTGELTFIASSTPGVQADATVKFQSSGRVEPNGKIVLTMAALPSVQQAWYFDSPTVVFATPAINPPVVEVSVEDQVVKLSLSPNSSAIESDTTYVFTISNVRTPSSVVNVSHMTVQSFDRDGNAIDAATKISVSSTDTGKLDGALTFETALDVPGIMQAATVSFTTAGQVLAEGHVVVTMPLLSGVQSVWTFDGPTVIFNTPAAGAPTASSSFSSRNLQITLDRATHAMAQSTAHVLQIANVRTPSSALPLGIAVIATYDSKMRAIDLSEDLKVDAITVGALEKSLALTHVMPSPGAITTASISFTSLGMVPIGGHIVVSMPAIEQLRSGWTFEAPSAVLLTNTTQTPTSLNVSLNVTVSAAETVLDFTVPSVMSQQTLFELRVKNTRTPSSVIDATSVSISTLDSKMNVIANGTAATQPILAGSFGAGSFSVLATPGVTTRANLSLKLSGRLIVSDRIEITLPHAWNMTSASPNVTVLRPAVGAQFSASFSVGAGMLVLTLISGFLTDGALQNNDLMVEVTHVATPANATAQLNATASSFTATGQRIDGPTQFPVSAVEAGALGGNRTWNTDTRTPALHTDAFVSFQVAGAVTKGGTIKLVLPVGGWILDAKPNVTLMLAAQLNNGSNHAHQVADWSPTARTLVMTVPTDIREAATLVIKIVAVRTPPTLWAAADASMSTFSPLGGVIDGPSTIAMSAITAGALRGSCSWTSTVKTPSVVTSVLVSFTTAGEIQTGGHITITMPASGWELHPAPIIAFDQPIRAGGEHVIGRGAWDENARTLVVTTLAGDITEATEVVLRINLVTTPKFAMDGDNATVFTTTPLDGLIDGNTSFDTPRIFPGKLGGVLQWSFGGAMHPSITSTATLSFVSAGSIASGARLEVALPTTESARWALPSNPSVVFSSPAGLNTLATSWSPIGSMLSLVTTDSAIGEGETVTFTVSDVMTPDSETSPLFGNVSTFTAQNGSVDVSYSMAVGEITPGNLNGLLTWDSRVDTPSARCAVNVSFRPSSPIPMGGRVKITLEDSGWRLNEAPSVTLKTNVTNVTTPARSASWAKGARELLVHFADSFSIPEYVDVVLTIADVVTPVSARSPSGALLVTLDDKGTTIDGPFAIVVNQITAGQLSSLAWNSAIDSPGTQSDVQVTFTTQSTVTEGGVLAIEMPVAGGWQMPRVPTGPLVAFKEPLGITGTSAWNATSRMLVITLAERDEIAASSAVHVAISDVLAPQSVRLAMEARLTTFTAAAGMIDGPSKMAINPIPAGDLHPPCQWVPRVPTPGVTTTVDVSFRSTGALSGPFSIDIELPDNGWRMPREADAAFVSASASINGSANPGSSMESSYSGSGSGSNAGYGSGSYSGAGGKTYMVADGSTFTGVVATWDSSRHMLHISVANGTVGSSTIVQFTVAGVTTPPSERAQTLAMVTTRAADGIVDGPSTAFVPEISRGKLHGPLTWNAQSNSAGVTTSVTLTMNVEGSVGVGGTVRLKLATGGWDLIASPLVRLIQPSEDKIAFPATAAAWNGTTRLLKLTVGTEIPNASTVVFVVHNVSTPPSARKSSNASQVATYAADGGLIDGPANVNTEKIIPGGIVTPSIDIADIFAPSNGSKPTEVSTKDVKTVAQLDVSGETVASFNATKQLIFRQAMAKILGVRVSQVEILWIKPRAPVTARRLSSELGGIDIQFSIVTNDPSDIQSLASELQATNFTAVLVNELDNNGFDLPESAITITEGTVHIVLVDGDASWESAVDTPGYTDTVSVRYIASGSAAAGSATEIQLPDEGWFIDMARFAVTFVKPAGARAIAPAWDGLTHRGGFTSNASIAQGELVDITIAGVRTPPAVTSKSSAVLSVRTAAGGLIYGPIFLETDAITAGTLVGALTWESEIDTPSVTQKVTLSFNVRGRVPSGGVVRVVLPDTGWTLPSEPEVALSISSPSSNAAAARRLSVSPQLTAVEPKDFMDVWESEDMDDLSVERILSSMSSNVGSGTVGSNVGSDNALPTGTHDVSSAVWSSANRTLSIALGSGAIEQDSEVVVTIGGVTTPSSARPAAQAQLTTFTGALGVIDGPTAIAMNKISPGELSSSLVAWDSFLDSPMLMSTATVTFNISSRLPKGGAVSIVLPCGGWDMPPVPTVEFAQPSTAVVGVGAWTSCTRTLLVTMAGEDIVIGRDAEPVQVRFTVANVTTPPRVMAASAANLTTFDPHGGVVDGPVSVATNAIVQAQYTSRWVVAPPPYVLASTRVPRFSLQVLNSSGQPHLTGEDTQFGEVVCHLYVSEVGGRSLGSDREQPAELLAGSIDVSLLASGNGTATFGGVTLNATLNATLGLAAHCDGVGAFDTLRFGMTVQHVTLRWADGFAPPLHMVPSATGGVVDTAKASRVQLVDHHGDVFASDSETTCSMSVAFGAGSGGAANTGRLALLSAADVVVERGEATFDPVAIDAPAGARVAVTVRCRRAARSSAEAIAPLVAGVEMTALEARWLHLPRGGVLANRRVFPNVSVVVFDATQRETYRYLSGSTPRIACSIAVHNASDAASGAAAAAALALEGKVSLVGNHDSVVRADGVAVFHPLRVLAPLGTTVWLAVDCKGPHALRTLLGAVRVEMLTARLVSQPAFVLVDQVMAFPSGELEPAPPLQLEVLYNSTGALFAHAPRAADDVTDMMCDVGVSRSSEGAAELSGDQTLHIAGGRGHFRDLSVSAPLGAVVELKLQCWASRERSELYALEPLFANVTVQDVSIAWRQAPPALMLSSALGSIAAIAAPVTIEMRNATGAVMADDSSAVCSLSVRSISAGGSAVRLLSPSEATLSSGVATFASVAVDAAAGATVRFTASCSRRLRSVESIPPITFDATMRTLVVREESAPAFVLSDRAVKPVIRVRVFDSSTSSTSSTLERYNSSSDAASLDVTCAVVLRGRRAEGGGLVACQAPGASDPCSLSGNVDTKADPLTGVATFDPLTFVAPLGTVLEIEFACRAAQPLPTMALTLSIGSVEMRWITPPPAYGFSSAKAGHRLAPLWPRYPVSSPPIELAIYDSQANGTIAGDHLTNATSKIVVKDFSTQCVASVALAPPCNEAHEVLFITEASGTRATAQAGHLFFRGLSLYAGKKQPGGDIISMELDSAAPAQLSRDCSSAVRLSFDCAWGGSSHKLNALKRNLTVQHLSTAWVFNPPETIQSTVEIGDCNPPRKKYRDGLFKGILANLTGFTEANRNMDCAQWLSASECLEHGRKATLEANRDWRGSDAYAKAHDPNRNSYFTRGSTPLVDSAASGLFASETECPTPFLTVGILNHTSNRHFTTPRVQCVLSIWSAFIEIQNQNISLIASGKATAELIAEKKDEISLLGYQPTLSGHTTVDAVGGIAQFQPVTVDAQLGTSVVLRASCSGANSLAVLDTGNIVVGVVGARWQTPLPKLMLLSSIEFQEPVVSVVPRGRLVEANFTFAGPAATLLEATSKSTAAEQVKLKEQLKSNWTAVLGEAGATRPQSIVIGNLTNPLTVQFHFYDSRTALETPTQRADQRNAARALLCLLVGSTDPTAALSCSTLAEVIQNPGLMDKYDPRGYTLDPKTSTQRCESAVLMESAPERLSPQVKIVDTSTSLEPTKTGDSKTLCRMTVQSNFDHPARFVHAAIRFEGSREEELHEKNATADSQADYRSTLTKTWMEKVEACQAVEKPRAISIESLGNPMVVRFDYSSVSAIETSEVVTKQRTNARKLVCMLTGTIDKAAADNGMDCSILLKDGAPCDVMGSSELKAEKAELNENKFRLENGDAIANSGVAQFDAVKVVRVIDHFSCEAVDGADRNFCPEVNFGDELDFKVVCFFNNKENLPMQELRHDRSGRGAPQIQTLRQVIVRKPTERVNIAETITPAFLIAIEKHDEDGQWIRHENELKCATTIQTIGAMVGGTADKIYSANPNPAQTTDPSGLPLPYVASFGDLKVTSTVTELDVQKAKDEFGKTIFNRQFRGHGVYDYLPLRTLFTQAKLFMGVGSNIRLRFACSNAMRGAQLDQEAQVDLKNCPEGKEPNMMRSTCTLCRDGFFSNAVTVGMHQMRFRPGEPTKYASNSNYHAELCQPCPGSPENEVSNNLATSNSAKTSCECNFGYYAVVDSPEYRARFNIGEAEVSKNRQLKVCVDEALAVIAKNMKNNALAAKRTSKQKIADAKSQRVEAYLSCNGADEPFFPSRQWQCDAKFLANFSAPRWQIPCTDAPASTTSTTALASFYDNAEFVTCPAKQSAPADLRHYKQTEEALSHAGDACTDAMTPNPWGYMCRSCPDGAQCKAKGMTFATLVALPGYWNVKDWYTYDSDAHGILRKPPVATGGQLAARLAAPDYDDSENSYHYCNGHHLDKLRGLGAAGWKAQYDLASKGEALCKGTRPPYIGAHPACQCLRTRTFNYTGSRELQPIVPNHRLLTGELSYLQCESPANGSMFCKGGEYAFDESDICQGARETNRLSNWLALAKGLYANASRDVGADNKTACGCAPYHTGPMCNTCMQDVITPWYRSVKKQTANDTFTVLEPYCRGPDYVVAGEQTAGAVLRCCPMHNTSCQISDPGHGAITLNSLTGEPWMIDYVTQNISYRMGTTGFCEGCPADGKIDTSIIIVLLLLPSLLILGCCFNKTIRSSIDRFSKYAERQQELLSRKLQEYGEEDEVMNELATIGNKVKIMIGLMQVLSQFTVNFKLIEWPAEFKQLAQKLKIFNFNFFSFKAVSCAARTTFPDTFFFMTCFPIAVILLCVLGHVLAKRFKVTVFQHQWVVYRISFGILFLVYPGTSNTVLRMLTCKTLADGRAYLVADLTIQCNPDPGCNALIDCDSAEYPLLFGLFDMQYARSLATSAFSFFYLLTHSPLYLFAANTPPGTRRCGCARWRWCWSTPSASPSSCSKRCGRPATSCTTRMGSATSSRSRRSSPPRTRSASSARCTRRTSRGTSTGR